MGRHGAKRDTMRDGRPLHGYGLEMENARNLEYNQRIDNVAASLFAGPAMAIVGLTSVTDSGLSTEARLLWLLLGIAGAALTVWAVISVVIGTVRWQRNRRRWKQDLESADHTDVPYVRLTGRRRY